MQIIENTNVKEKLYIEKLDNGLTVMIIPKKNIQKKYVIWATHYGSIDNRFIIPGEKVNTEVPDGVAHFLEHKMFEQENRYEQSRCINKARSKCKCIYNK